MSIETLDEFQLYKSSSHRIYAIPMEDFQKLYIQTWEYNRPHDPIRVSEIQEEMRRSRHMDGILSLAFIPKVGLVCYEGNHRRLALCQEVKYVLVDILWNVSHEEVTAEFRRINKSVSVPDIYVCDDTTLKVEIQDLVASYSKKYQDHASAAAKPQRPNFNRDNLSDQLFRLSKELNITVSDLATRLEWLNIQYSKQDMSNVPPKIVHKCGKNGLWLFMFSTSIPTAHLQQWASRST